LVCVNKPRQVQLAFLLAKVCYCKWDLRIDFMFPLNSDWTPRTHNSSALTTVQPPLSLVLVERLIFNLILFVPCWTFSIRVQTTKTLFSFSFFFSLRFFLKCQHCIPPKGLNSWGVFTSAFLRRFFVENASFNDWGDAIFKFHRAMESTVYPTSLRLFKNFNGCCVFADNFVTVNYP
jgi:hypothetical protein